jgi:hypothetical protein
MENNSLLWQKYFFNQFFPGQRDDNSDVHSWHSFGCRRRRQGGCVKIVRKNAFRCNPPDGGLERMAEGETRLGEVVRTEASSVVSGGMVYWPTEVILESM